MTGETLKVWRCPVHGGQLTEGQRCRVVVKRTDRRITHCHEAEEVEVAPASELREVEEKLRKFVDAVEFEVGCMEDYGAEKAGVLGKLAREMAEPLREALAALPGQEEK